MLTVILPKRHKQAVNFDEFVSSTFQIHFPNCFFFKLKFQLSFSCEVKKNSCMNFSCQFYSVLKTLQISQDTCTHFVGPWMLPIAY